MEGLLLGGLAMQINKSSRPTSGAEHQFSHLWNMEHHTLVTAQLRLMAFRLNRDIGIYRPLRTDA